MQHSRTPPSLISLLFALLAQTQIADAGPYPKDDLHDLGFAFLQPRECVSYCGADNQYCCTHGQGCFTNAGVASCIATAAPVAGAGVEGVYGVYTTTWTETNLVTKTSTISYAIETTPAAWVAPLASDVPAICTPSLGESSCGKICCASDQRCAPEGNTCTAYSSAYLGVSTYSSPLRPTDGAILTITSLASATTTVPFQAPATASGSTFPITQTDGGDGLSAGAIAGIVVGVIAGVILLLLICFCCIVKTGFEGLLAIFGLGKKKRRSTERIKVEERYSRYGSGTASGRDTHAGWFGGSRPTKVTEKRKKDSGLGGLGMVGAGLLGMAAILGLKRKHDRKSRSTVTRSDISSTYYTDSYTGTYTGTSASK
ncbi:hypothetical protein QTJ16_003987 [Diplocarpon rosae]|uniref:Uncharacterized protein n=1 Tax=Diplocarpon rosae TaxID=946125 RepID=A0AAD9T190_9HELO|nr:hypothetical protein QTJ16_003987 [Diplocarpon rosae]PBP26894.1 hypothetical protein BUE80_DR002210 [Diplocarpon rosae]